MDNDFHSVNMISKPCDKIDLVVKQKIQDNLSVLEKDCSEILTQTENVLRKNVTKKARLNTISRMMLFEGISFVLGVILFSLYLVVNLMNPDSELISNPKMLSENLKELSLLDLLLTTKNYISLYLPSFSVLPFIRTVGIFIGINMVVFWLLRFVKSFYTVMSKDGLGSLQ